MIRQDDRTAEQRITHRWAVVARDKFMSGWGGAEGGASRCAWAVPAGEFDRDYLGHMLHWVQSRPEMLYVNAVDLDSYRPPRGTAHFHIYVADPETHPAFATLRRYTALTSGEA